jgi:hypothetical protein
MDPGVSLLLGAAIGYLVNIASGERLQAIVDRRKRKLDEAIERTYATSDALASRRTLGDDIAAVCAELARNRETLGITTTEEPLWWLLSDQAFQADLTEWFVLGGIAEGAAVEARLVETMREALAAAGADEQHTASLTTQYLDDVGRAIFARPVLSRWRHQLSLDYLRGQVAALKVMAEENAGVYSEEKREAATAAYCEKALGAWGIIDTKSLPEGDALMAAQKLLLRELYIPLRVEVEAEREGHRGAADLDSLEEKRAPRS